MTPNRASGVLLHPSSLPGPLGCGDLGADAYRFVDWLAEAGQSLWQMLPLAPTGDGHSPYMSPSAFALEPMLIDLVELHKRGWLDADAVDPLALPAETAAIFARATATRRCAFDASRAYRMTQLRRACDAFFDPAQPDLSDAPGGDQRMADATVSIDAFETFCTGQAHWLDDYALFMAISAKRPGERWQEWAEPIRARRPNALARLAGTYSNELRFWRFVQWTAARQWDTLRAYASAHGVRIVGDVPIFVSGQSADVWAHPGLFDLDTDGEPIEVAGVPPDYFSATGQRWGNPLYAWEAHAQTDYAWWTARLRRQTALSDIVRIDHFRGLVAYWAIPAQSVDATSGRWRPGPGAGLFDALHAALGELPIIAEDLGTITPDVHALREQFDLPGMRVLHFAFSEDADHAYLPHQYERDTVVYTGTHDNDTTVGWFAQTNDHERRFVQTYFKSDGREIHWELIHAASQSVANLAIWPMQDVLGLPGSERMNVPGLAAGNWSWRFDWAQIAPWDTRRLREIAAVHGRNGASLPD